MADTARARKLADRIHEIVAEALEKRIKDPRLGFVTVTDTRVTNDLQHATVFYTVFGDAEEKVASAAALESARGVLRSEVGRRTGIRLTPTLDFIADAVPENAAHIEDLLRTAAARDADVAALAATADYAGDPDPYRREDDVEDHEDEDAAGPGEHEDAAEQHEDAAGPGGHEDAAEQHEDAAGPGEHEDAEDLGDGAGGPGRDAVPARGERA